MIEAEHAGRIGFTQGFTTGDDAAVDAALGRLQSLGVRHLRLPMTQDLCGTEAGIGWIRHLLTRLAPELDVLPYLRLGQATTVPDWVRHLLAEFTGIEAVEFRAGLPALRALGQAARDAGCRAVLGVAAQGATAWLQQAGEAGALADFDAIGLHAVPPAEGRATWNAMLADIGETARCFNPDLAVWITQTGYGAWRHDAAHQAQLFTEAVAAPAGRVFWSTLFDQPGAGAPDSASGHSGIFDHAGQPKLLGRLLEGGVTEVERVLATARRLKLPSVTATRPVLVTGGAGFIGANLADRLAAEGHHVHIYDALARAGVERNLHWLARRHPTRVSFALGDLRDETALTEAATRAEAVFHLAGQVAVTTSMVDPLADFAVNARGTLALLETLRRHNPAAPLVFASTNKVYGDLADIELVREGESYLPARADLRGNGVSEQRPLCFHTPYGCSKGTADQYVLDYAHSFGLRTAVLRMSCIYGERQLGTEDQGWVAHFLLKAIAGEGLTIYGDGRQVRDVLHVGDAVSAYLSAWSRIDAIAGRAYNLGGGPANAISLLQLVAHIEDLLGRRVDVTFAGWRPGDQRYFVADTAAARRDLALAPALGWRAGIARLAEHFGAVALEAAEVAQ